MQRYYIFFIPANVLYLFTPNRINEGVIIDECPVLKKVYTYNNKNVSKIKIKYYV